MDPGPNQSTTTTTAPAPPLAPPPADADITEYIELQVLPAATATTAEPLPWNTDDLEENEVDVPVPLGVKLTTYRLLNLVILLVFGLAKFILSLKGQSAAPIGLELAGGSMFAALSYWIGLYEPVQPRRWEWLLHVDLAPAIGFIMKCFLVGVLRAFALYWEILLLWLFAGIFLLVQARHDITDVYFTFFIQHGPLYTMFVTFLVAVLSEFLVRCLVFFLTARLPEKWCVWKRMRGPVGRFLRKYGSNCPKCRGYRLRDKAGFILASGHLSGIILIRFLVPIVGYFVIIA